MSVAHSLIIDQLSPPVDGEQHLATWYTQGHSDGLGDRLLMFDNTSAPSWEILRFRPALARDQRFEAALRQRVEQLASFRHPAFPLVRPLKGLGHEDGLAVVSTFAPGLRLSEAMNRPRSVAFAVRLIRQLVPAIAALQQHGPNIYSWCTRCGSHRGDRGRAVDHPRAHDWSRARQPRVCPPRHCGRISASLPRRYQWLPPRSTAGPTSSKSGSSCSRSWQDAASTLTSTQTGSRGCSTTSRDGIAAGSASGVSSAALLDRTCVAARRLHVRLGVRCQRSPCRSAR